MYYMTNFKESIERVLCGLVVSAFDLQVCEVLLKDAAFFDNMYIDHKKFIGLYEKKLKDLLKMDENDLSFKYCINKMAMNLEFMDSLEEKK